MDPVDARELPVSTVARIRSHRRRPLTKKRRHELRVLAENKMMTVEHFQSWKRGQDARGTAFMDRTHELHCSCGNNVHATIVDACDLGWLVTTRDCEVTRSTCPKCSTPGRRQLERDVAAFVKTRPN